MRPFLILVLTAALGTVLWGCSSGGSDPDSAVRVAETFWNALENQDFDTARSQATSETAGMINETEDGANENAEVTLGQASVSGDTVEIATTMKTTQDGESMEVPMTTYLVQESGAWKVDVNRTMMSVFGGALGEMMEQMGKAMSEGMQEMGTAMGEAMDVTADDMAGKNNR